MGFVTALLSLLGSSAVGSALGGLFAWLNRKTDVDVLKLQLADKGADRAHELAMRDKDYAQAQLEASSRKDVAIAEGDATVAAAQMAAIASVQASDELSADEIKAAGWWGWALTLADAAKRTMRPALTVALVGCGLAVEWMALRYFMKDGWSAIDANAKFAIASAAFDWVTGQASIVVAYWFVSRGSAANIQRNT